MNISTQVILFLTTFGVVWGYIIPLIKFSRKRFIQIEDLTKMLDANKFKNVSPLLEFGFVKKEKAELKNAGFSRRVVNSEDIEFSYKQELKPYIKYRLKNEHSPFKWHLYWFYRFKVLFFPKSTKNWPKNLAEEFIVNLKASGYKKVEKIDFIKEGFDWKHINEWSDIDTGEIWYSNKNGQLFSLYSNNVSAWTK